MLTRFHEPVPPTLYHLYQLYLIYILYPVWYTWYMEQSIEDIRFMLAHELKNRRKELGLTQAELAIRMDIAQPHVARMEAVGAGAIETLLQWCVALDMKLSLEPMTNPTLVEKAMDDPEAIEALMDAPPEEIVEIKDGADFSPQGLIRIEEVLAAGDDPTKAILITEKTTAKQISEAVTKKNPMYPDGSGRAKDYEVCKHGNVKGFCKKGCK